MHQVMTYTLLFDMHSLIGICPQVMEHKELA